MGSILLGKEWILHLLFIGTLNFFSPDISVPPFIQFQAAGAIVLTPIAIDGPDVEADMLAVVAQNFTYSAIFLWSAGGFSRLRYTVGLMGSERKKLWRWMLYAGIKRT